MSVILDLSGLYDTNLIETTFRQHLKRIRHAVELYRQCYCHVIDVIWRRVLKKLGDKEHGIMIIITIIIIIIIIIIKTTIIIMLYCIDRNNTVVNQINQSIVHIILRLLNFVCTCVYLLLSKHMPFMVCLWLLDL